MSGWAGSGDSPPADRDPDAALRQSVSRGVASWRDRLAGAGSADAQARLASSIRHEAVQLRAAVQTRAFMALAQRLYRIELCCDQAPQALGIEVNALLTALPQLWVPSPQPGDAVRAGPAGAPPAGPVAPAADSPAGQQPAPAARPSGARQVAQTLFGLRGFGRASATPPRPSEAGGDSVLKLRPLPVGSATPAPEMPWTGRKSRPSRLEGGDLSRPHKSSSRIRWKGSKPARGAWPYLLAGGIAALGFATALVLVWTRAHHAGSGAQPQVTTVAPDAGSAQPSASGAPSPVDQITALLHQIGQESDQLHALMEAQGKGAARCLDDPSQCERGYAAKSVWAMHPVDAGALPQARADEPLPMWLRRLRLPTEFPLHDGPLLRGMFEYNVHNIEGRQRLESMLFKCSAYENIFTSTLQKYGAPLWIMAVVYQESACNPRARSSVGAMGLWQFMPESGRAYGLKVIEDEVDERLNPVKSTDAAIHMLTDLERKFGAWDLAFAAYNMGPFALSVRLEQTGRTQGFWQLAGEELLPDETARYVPAIEAYALVLENRARLGLPSDGPPLESTAEVVLKSGTRLSFLARAAHTSTQHIRELNPEFLHDDVPSGETTARVPDSEAHRAQELLDSPPRDDVDLCVPETFDWGRDRFATSVYAASCGRDH